MLDLDNNDLRVNDRVAYLTQGRRQNRLRVGRIVDQIRTPGSLNPTDTSFRVRPDDGYKGRSVIRRPNELVKVK